MIDRDDRELEQYLSGGRPLSRRYREASRETAPPQLDEIVLAEARAAAARKPRLNRWLTPIALAATVMLGVNLAWNLREHAGPAPQPVPAGGNGPGNAPETQAKVETSRSPPPAGATAAPPAMRRDSKTPGAAAPAVAPPDPPMATALAAAEQERAARTDLAEQRMSAADAERDRAEAKTATPALSESAKIELLLDYLLRLKNAGFIRNGAEHGAEEAVSHLRMKRDAAGDRVRTASDFIDCCATGSAVSGEPYRLRFADGRVRPVAEVLREQLREIEASGP